MAIRGWLAGTIDTNRAAWRTRLVRLWFSQLFWIYVPLRYSNVLYQNYISAVSAATRFALPRRFPFFFLSWGRCQVKGIWELFREILASRPKYSPDEEPGGNSEISLSSEIRDVVDPLSPPVPHLLMTPNQHQCIAGGSGMPNLLIEADCANNSSSQVVSPSSLLVIETEQPAQPLGVGGVAPFYSRS